MSFHEQFPTFVSLFSRIAELIGYGKRTPAFDLNEVVNEADRKTQLDLLALRNLEEQLRQFRSTVGDSITASQQAIQAAIEKEQALATEAEAEYSEKVSSTQSFYDEQVAELEARIRVVRQLLEEKLSDMQTAKAKEDSDRSGRLSRADAELSRLSAQLANLFNQ